MSHFIRCVHNLSGRATGFDRTVILRAVDERSKRGDEIGLGCVASRGARDEHHVPARRHAGIESPRGLSEAALDAVARRRVPQPTADDDAHTSWPSVLASSSCQDEQWMRDGRSARPNSVEIGGSAKADIAAHGGSVTVTSDARVRRG